MQLVLYYTYGGKNHGWLTIKCKARRQVWLACLAGLNAFIKVQTDT